MEIDKELLVAIINSLKQIKPADYASMDILVGCVTMLESSAREKVKDNPLEGGEITNE